MSDDPEVLKIEIDQTRHELARDLEALRARLDVKARARERAQELGHAVAEQLRRPPVQAGLVTLGALVVVLLVRRARRRS